MNALEFGRKIVDELKIDFQQFTMEQFVHSLEGARGRKIFLFPIPLPSIDGAWITDNERPHEYIFYDSNLPPIHQVHVQLHELGHFLCGHQTLAITSENLVQLIDVIKQQNNASVTPQLLMRAFIQDEKEAEAEAVAMIIQSRVIEASRIRELSKSVSTNTDQFLEDMGLR